MTVIVKKPGKRVSTEEVDGMNQIYDIVSPSGKPEFDVFIRKHGIGIITSDYVDDSFTNRNFVFHNRMIYGTVAFVGLDDDGKAKSLTVYQTAIIENFMDHNAIG